MPELTHSTFESEAPLIHNSVEQLRFRFQDIRILLVTHAHRDHSGDARRVKELAGAQPMVLDQGVTEVETGGG
jgi:metallo-beta-lactamase class B